MNLEENSDEMLLHKQTAEHLLNIGNYLSTSCPSASRFYMYNLERRHIENPNLLKNYSKFTYQFCHHCGSIWSRDNCKIHIQKRPPVNYHLKKLLNSEANQPWKLNIHQKKKLRKFRESTSKLVYICLSCKKKTVYPGNKQSNIKCHYLGQSASNTPKSAIKLKKGDLNAGLFIPSPCNLDNNERNNLKNSDSSERIKECETPPVNKEKTILRESPATPGNKGKILKTPDSGNVVTPKNIKHSPILQVPSSEKQSTSKQKKKTLLAQILNDEQNKKKKTSISSFLISL